MQPPTDHIKRIWTTTLERIEHLIEMHMMTVARDWQAQFPKRQVRFVDAMGMAGFLIDGEWVEIPQKYSLDLHPRRATNFTTWGYTSGERHKHTLLMPLFDAMEWYATMISTCENVINIEFTLEPLQ